MPYVNDGRVLRDGESIRVSLDMLDHSIDSVQRQIAATFDARLHQPGFRTSDDVPVRDARRQARAEYVRRLCDSWKRPACDAAEPDAGERRAPDDPGTMMRRHLEQDDAAALREKSWRARNDELKVTMIEPFWRFLSSKCWRGIASPDRGQGREPELTRHT